MDEEGKKTRINFLGFLKRTFWAGIATLFPLFITVYLVIVLFKFADNFIGDNIQVFLMQQYNIKIPGLGVILLVLIILAAGLLSRFFLGRWITTLIDRLFKKIPLIANIYPSAKQLSDFLFEEKKGKDKFRKAVLVEFPAKDLWSVGFITNEELASFQNALSEETVCVFIPLAPAPFSGFVCWVAKNKVKELNMSVDRAVKFILSGGVVAK